MTGWAIIFIHDWDMLVAGWNLTSCFCIPSGVGRLAKGLREVGKMMEGQLTHGS